MKILFALNGDNPYRVGMQKSTANKIESSRTFKTESEATTHWNNLRNGVSGSGMLKDGSGRRVVTSEMEWNKDGTFTVTFVAE